ncbi:MAG: flagellin [Myxococcota bacterium]
MLSVRTNVSSLNAQRNLSSNQMQLDQSLNKLSSGYRINRASDDAAGLGVSTNMNAQIRSYNQAVRNANDGLSVVQTAESALNEVANILTRMRELTMQSASDGVGATERAYIQEENAQLIAELDRIDAVAEFNGVSLFGASAAMQFQVGIRSTANDVISIDLTAGIDSASLGTSGGITMASVDLGSSAGINASTAAGYLGAIDDAIDQISNYRSQLGAVANRLNSTISFVKEAAEATSAANSRIRDVDIAEETSKLSASQVLMQAGVSMLSQANQAPQVALKLLG